VIGVLLAAQLVLTLLVSEETLRGIVLASGQGGELALGATLCALFHVRFPRVTRWPSSRWFFLGCGAVSYVFAMRKWLRARADPDAVPWGSFWGGDGAMEHVQAMGVSTEQLVSIYLWIAALSGLVLAVVWLASWRRARA
ncbi:MAG: hypothetical protein JST92_08650, partial [Deltaproteobacteria bacterium]|nr:hypothetical protein [Deltaproteobacteria bacterium]